MKSKVFAKIVLGALAGGATLMFVSCGSKLSGTYKTDFMGIEAGYTLKSGNKVTAFSPVGTFDGTYTFDESTNVVKVEFAGETHELVFDEAAKTLTDEMIIYTKK